MPSKQALSATVDADVLRAAEAAVREGRAPNVSAWVNDAMRRKMEHEARMRALDVFIGAYEAEHGAITQEESCGPAGPLRMFQGHFATGGRLIRTALASCPVSRPNLVPRS